MGEAQKQREWVIAPCYGGIVGEEQKLMGCKVKGSAGLINGTKTGKYGGIVGGPTDTVNKNNI